MTPLALAERVNALLPQTQCTKCGYPACRPYAEALAAGNAQINRCPPGGHSGIARLALLLHRPVLPLDPSCGVEKPLELARIEEQHCIGCTLCIDVCPVDAIVGAAKLMHSVVAELCSGCSLCIPVCPVDYIAMTPAAYAWDERRALDAQRRHEARTSRLSRARESSARPNESEQEPGEEAMAETRGEINDAAAGSAQSNTNDSAAVHKRVTIDAAIARARERKGARR